MLKVLLGKVSPSSPELAPLFSDCTHVAAARVRDCLLFLDPENRFHPSAKSLREIFLMAYIHCSIRHNLPNSFKCTVMTPEQRTLLGVDWVWTVLDGATRLPRIQMAVRVLHQAHRNGENEDLSESMQIAHMESSGLTYEERIVRFCTAVGRDCYTLFLLFGRKADPHNVYGVLSNNFQAAVGKLARIDQDFIENFFRGSRSFVTPEWMLKSALNTRGDAPLTMLIRFS
ncbi:rab15 effector protein [Denticeps clupeoides]|uniref:Uncharacterized protein n=1 Tax=Denticeps clupeoides TaxID=299321 RepID=A0AAY4C9C0_9TELE|nr:rab15 effector protein [Denticeps clupeoides]